MCVCVLYECEGECLFTCLCECTCILCPLPLYGQLIVFALEMKVSLWGGGGREREGEKKG